MADGTRAVGSHIVFGLRCQKKEVGAGAKKSCVKDAGACPQFGLPEGVNFAAAVIDAAAERIKVKAMRYYGKGEEFTTREAAIRRADVEEIDYRTFVQQYGMTAERDNVMYMEDGMIIKERDWNGECFIVKYEGQEHEYWPICGFETDENGMNIPVEVVGYIIWPDDFDT